MRSRTIGTARHRVALAALFALLLVSLLLFGQPTAVSADVTVNIQNFAFAPGSMTIPVGMKVVWMNQDDAVHTTTSDAPLPIWDSGTLKKGQSFSFTFTQAGSRAPANIPIAGDADNAGPTYAAFGTTAATLLAITPAQTGMNVTTMVAANGTVTPGAATPGSGPTALSVYDSVTQHNVPAAFGAYRDKVGLLTIGYAKSEPFLATVKVGGAPKQVMVQVFERRVLTYTADNPDPFKVEMGNIGQHYLRWRYQTGS